MEYEAKRKELREECKWAICPKVLRKAEVRLVMIAFAFYSYCFSFTEGTLNL